MSVMCTERIIGERKRNWCKGPICYGPQTRQRSVTARAGAQSCPYGRGLRAVSYDPLALGLRTVRKRHVTCKGHKPVRKPLSSSFLSFRFLYYRTTNSIGFTHSWRPGATYWLTLLRLWKYCLSHALYVQSMDLGGCSYYFNRLGMDKYMCWDALLLQNQGSSFGVNC